jgi:hypothetical protein
MSYDISFRVKVEGIDRYVDAFECDANITWNVRKIIELSTGLPWVNEANNGYVKDIIPSILKGYKELTEHPEKYKKYEAPNGWGTVEGTARFFIKIIETWERFCKWEDEELTNIATFWIH